MYLRESNTVPVQARTVGLPTVGTSVGVLCSASISLLHGVAILFLLAARNAYFLISS